MLKARPLYRCGLEEHWRRQTGELRPATFAKTIGGCEDLIQRLELYSKLEAHNGCVNTVHFNPTGELLVSGSDDRQIIFWDWAAKSKKFAYNSGHESNVFQARVMPFTNDRSIVSCAADGQVRHGQVLGNGNVETKMLTRHKGRAHKLAIEPGSPCIFFSCGEDGVVRHFDMREPKNQKLFTCHSFQTGSDVKPCRRAAVRLNTIVVNPRNCNIFSVGGSDQFARVYDIRRVHANASGKDDDQPVDSFAPKHLKNSDQVHITCVAYSQQEELLVSYNDELIYCFDKDMGLGPNPEERKPTEDQTVDQTQLSCGPQPKRPEEPQVYKGHRNAQTVKGVNFLGPNTEYVVSGSDCGRVFIWKKRGGELLAMFVGDNQVVNCLEPHPFAHILATSGIDKSVKLWAPTAERRIPLPCDAEKIMEANRQRREDRSHVTLTPDLLMHVLRFQQQAGQSESEFAFRARTMFSDGLADEDDDGAYPDGEFLEEESSEDGAPVNPHECVVS